MLLNLWKSYHDNPLNRSIIEELGKKLRYGLVTYFNLTKLYYDNINSLSSLPQDYIIQLTYGYFMGEEIDKLFKSEVTLGSLMGIPVAVKDNC